MSDIDLLVAKMQDEFNAAQVALNNAMDALSLIKSVRRQELVVKRAEADLDVAKQWLCAKIAVRILNNQHPYFSLPGTVSTIRVKEKEILLQIKYQNPTRVCTCSFSDVGEYYGKDLKTFQGKAPVVQESTHAQSAFMVGDVVRHKDDVPDENGYHTDLIHSVKFDRKKNKCKIGFRGWGGSSTRWYFADDYVRHELLAPSPES